MELTKEEVWRDIPEYEGLYQVSSCGRVRSLDRLVPNTDRWGKERTTLYRGKMKATQKNCRNNYMSVMLYKDKIGKRVSVHRLVASAFIPNPNHLPQVNHKNEIRTDNRVENLEWCDDDYNRHYGTCRQRISATKSHTVIAIDAQGRMVGEYQNARYAGVVYGVTGDAIYRNIKNGSCNRNTGHYFKYKEKWN